MFVDYFDKDGICPLVQRIVQDGRSAPSVCVPPQLLKCCFTATETVGLLGTGAQDGHLNFHTAPELGPPPWTYIYI